MAASVGTASMRIISIDPYSLAPRELSDLLLSMPDAVLIDTLSQIEDVIGSCIKQRPDVAIFVTDWSDNVTIDTIRELHVNMPSIHITLITMQLEPLRVATVFASGALGYVTHEGIADLPCILRLVSRGCIACCSVSTRQLTTRIVESRKLSSREMTIAAQVVAGQTSPEIADLLGIKTSTVETHIERILRKIDGRTRIDIATWWMGRIGAFDEGDTEADASFNPPS